MDCLIVTILRNSHFNAQSSQSISLKNTNVLSTVPAFMPDESHLNKLPGRCMSVLWKNSQFSPGHHCATPIGCQFPEEHLDNNYFLLPRMSLTCLQMQSHTSPREHGLIWNFHGSAQEASHPILEGICCPPQVRQGCIMQTCSPATPTSGQPSGIAPLPQGRPPGYAFANIAYLLLNLTALCSTTCQCPHSSMPYADGSSLMETPTGCASMPRAALLQTTTLSMVDTVH